MVIVVLLSSISIIILSSVLYFYFVSVRLTHIVRVTHKNKMSRLVKALEIGETLGQKG